jgi:aspartyl protease family protein
LLAVTVEEPTTPPVARPSDARPVDDAAGRTEAATMQCSFHLDTDATEFCLSCETPLCETCAYRLRNMTLCVHCYAPRIRRRERVRAVVWAVGLAVLVVGAYSFYASSAEVNQLRRRYGAYADEILRLRHIWEADRCNLPAGEQLVDLLVESSNAPEARDVAASMASKCPSSTEALVKLFFIQRRLLDLEAAIGTADRVIKLAPFKPEGYAYRAIAREAAGELEAAVHDFRQALKLSPRLLDVPVNLANVLEKMGRFCEAADPLEQAISYYPGLDNRYEIESRIERLRQQGDCVRSSLAGSEVAVQFDRREEVIVVDARVNAEHDGRFIVDTGASSVVITRGLAEKVGVKDLRKTSPVFVQTAGGVVNAFPARLESIDVNGAEVVDVPVLVCETMGDDVDGLLGINFLSRFNVSIDHHVGKITFRQRDEK